jgi:cyclopropane-fatty-acyl-phospholipid synthase
LGGRAREAACRGLRVTGITLSREQLAFARERLRRAGLAGRIELRLQDYRDVLEEFDHVVSIEMFEAVGEAYWPAYFESIRRVLRRGGRAALQVITIDDGTFDAYRREADFVQKYIFPGGMLPSLEAFRRCAAEAGLATRDVRFYGGDYALTLRRWDEAVRRAAPAIRKLGFDDRFLRMWRYYLAYCEAGFRDGRIDLMQVTLEDAGSKP